VQIVGVTYGGSFMHTVPLRWDQWRKCILFSIAPIPIGILLRLIPIKEPVVAMPFDQGETHSNSEEDRDDFTGTKKERFQRAVHKVITQLRVVGALAALVRPKAHS
jgi:hypothetical protein